jgi:hypothetical protein
MEDFVQLLKDKFKILRTQDVTRFISKNENILEFVLEKTHFINNLYVDIPMFQRLWHILNDNYKPNKCKNCDNYTNFKTMTLGYNESCSQTCMIKHRPPRIYTKEELERLSKSMSGENGPMYGKSVYSVWVEKYGVEEADKREVKFRSKQSKSMKIVYDNSSQEQKNKSIHKGEKNGMYGKSIYDVWLFELGKEGADKRMAEFKLLQSSLSSGENNPMFGKPSPKGSGNGWCGWFMPNGWFFRSLRELSYMINEIYNKNLYWENGELKKYKIKYVDWEGKTRNYFPDFIVGDKYMIECKPKKLHNSPNVVAKKKGAEKFCKENGLEYKLVDQDKVEYKIMVKLHDEGIIKFTDRYEEKFKTYIHKESNLKRS